MVWLEQMRNAVEKIVMDRLGEVILRPFHDRPEWQAKNNTLQQRCRALRNVLLPRHLDLLIVNFFAESPEKDKDNSDKTKDEKTSSAITTGTEQEKEEEEEKRIVENEEEPPLSVCPSELVLDVIAIELQKMASFNAPHEMLLQVSFEFRFIIKFVHNMLQRYFSLLQVHLAFEMVSRAVLSAQQTLHVAEGNQIGHMMSSGADDLLPVFIMVRVRESWQSVFADWSYQYLTMIVWPFSSQGGNSGDWENVDRRVFGGIRHHLQQQTQCQ